MSIAVYRSEIMQQWDAYTIANEPISSLELMERAATLACKSILGRNLFESANIYCGPGNNGGDGLVIARLLHESGKKVRLYILDFGTRTADFEANFKRLPNEVEQISLNETSHTLEQKADIQIDCIFGSGLARPVEGWIGNVIEQINALDGKTIAIDIPSGLFSTDNHKQTAGKIIRANETLTFMSPKMAFFFSSYHQFVGNFRLINIGLHPEFKGETEASFVQSNDIQLHSKHLYDHKGKNGFLSMIGGLDDMSGAAIIASEAAMRSGSGYVHCVSDQDTKIALNSRCPEVIWSSATTTEIHQKSTAIAIGPGLGTTDRAFELLTIALKSGLPIVIDADAINLISEHPILLKALPKNAVLTPHLGELKRLIGDADSEESLLEKQKEFSLQHNVFIIQKGPFSKLTCSDGSIIVNSTGNPGMATAGMGDALTGLIGSLLAQGYNSKEAATYGMYLHGFAADEQMKNEGITGLLATDVVNRLPEAINKHLRT